MDTNKYINTKRKKYVNTDGYFHTSMYPFSLTTVHILPTLLLVGQLGHFSFLHVMNILQGNILSHL